MIRTPPPRNPEPGLLTVTEAVEDWIARPGLSMVSIERVFAQDSLRSVIGIAQIMGIAMATMARAGLEMAQHTPSEAEAVVMGSGTADKAQTQVMITRTLGFDAPPRLADIANALAQTICHGWRGGGTGTDDITEMISAGGMVYALARTPAQRQRAAAQAAARRTGVVDLRRVRH